MTRQVRVPDTALVPHDKLNRNLSITSGSTTIAAVVYSDLQYQELQPVGTMNELSREELILHAVRRQKADQVRRIKPELRTAEGTDEETCLKIVTVLMPIKRSYVLAGCSDGGVSLAVNGRAGRRVVCVLDHKKAVLDVLDVEGDAEDESEGEEEEPERS